MTDYELDFLALLRNQGFDIDSIKSDGIIHRCEEVNKKGKRNCAYIFYSDDPISGWYQNWRTGESGRWYPPDYKVTKKLKERNRIFDRYEKRAKVYQAEEASKEALKEFANGIDPDPDFSYLKKKRISGIGALQDDKGLMIPQYRFYNNKVEQVSFQRIFPDGKKGNYRGVNKNIAEVLFFIFGNIEENETIYYTEGYATGHTVYDCCDRESTIIVAFGSDSIEKTVNIFVKQYPQLDHVICADNDADKEKNVGLETAKSVAEQYNISYCVPNITGDFNDLFCNTLDVESVKKCLLNTVIFGKKGIQDSDNSINYRRGKILKMKRYEWIWTNRLLFGGINLIAGHPSTGKSTITTDFAARVSAGLPWPDNEPANIRGTVAILSAEDDPESTIIPRFYAHGGDLNNLLILDYAREKGDVRSIDLRRDAKYFEDLLRREPDIKMLIIDPISSYLPGMDGHKNTEVRSALEPLSRYAKDNGICVILVTHFHKTTNDSRSALERVTGSNAFGALARVVWVTVQEKVQDEESDDEKIINLFISAKSNLTKKPTGFYYEIDENFIENEQIRIGKINWIEETNRSADMILSNIRNNMKEDNKKISEAIELLEGMLIEGQAYSKDIFIAGKSRDISEKTLYRAKAKLGIKARKASNFEDSENKWIWYK